MAFAQQPLSYSEQMEAFQKERVQSVFGSRRTTACYRPGFETVETRDDTEFEEDASDFEEYEGRRSEDSYGKRSETTLSSFDELRTPNLAHGFEGFNFQLDDGRMQQKSVQGPVGPHLFRMSQESSAKDMDFYISMSPPESPEIVRHPSLLQRSYSQREEEDSVEAFYQTPKEEPALRSWSTRQVAEWMYGTGFDKSLVDHFFINDISGETLIDLQYDDLKELGITSFGQRHRLWNEIRNLRSRKLGQVPAQNEPVCYTPVNAPNNQIPVQPPKPCSSPESPDEEYIISPVSGQRRGRSARDDIISPAESASIVAIEQLLPKPHNCSKGENCSKWQKQQRKLAKLATEFPLEMAQIVGAKASSPVESGFGGVSVIVPSVVASSDLLGPGHPPVRLEEGALRVVQSRDPQENVRHFLDFQHVNHQTTEDPSTPPYEMFPPLSPPPKGQAPHSNLRSLPKLTIPETTIQDAFSPNRTIVPGKDGRALAHDIYRLGSPASEMDVPVTAIPLGPIERDVSSSVPPDMRFGQRDIVRSQSRSGHRGPPPLSFTMPQQNSQAFSPIKRSTSHAGHRSRRPSFNMAPLPELQATNTAVNNNTAAEDELTPIAPTDETINGHAGWMKKRKTKMLRHEWQDNYFRLNGTQLAMHRDEKPTAAPLECIDVDDYSVAISANKSKLNSAMKRLHLNSKKNEGDPAAFAFQLTPAADRKHAATGKTHHFAVTTATDRIEWMRELMLARAKQQKDMVHSSFE